jgi:peptidoglycan hydrolase-like protein with peptidoglycan-binding domain
VTAVQPRVGLPADGVPGPATLGALVKEVAVGSLGNVVEAAQTLLNGNGAQLVVDGDFGAGSKAAAVAYQASKGLVADGIVGRNTWTALFGGGAGSTPPPTDPPPTDPEPVDPEPQPTEPPTPTETEPGEGIGFTDPKDPPILPTDPPTVPPSSTDESGPRTTSGTGATDDPVPMSQASIGDWRVYAYLSG